MKVQAYIQGGLGNQCFIYAAARSLADRVGAELLLDQSYLVHDAVYRRPFELESFNVRSSQMISVSSKMVHLLRKFRYGAASRMTLRLRNYFCETRPFTFQTLPTHWNNELTLEGYWQSERYFADNVKQITKDLTFRNLQWMEDDPIALAIRQCENSIFLHIRSYKEVPGWADGRASLPLEYYVSALAKLKSLISGDIKVFVFSDDLNWAMEKVAAYVQSDTVFVRPIHDGRVNNKHRDFQLMQLCMHGIVANSSFSWWAGWLGEQDWLAKGKTPIRIRVDRRCMNNDYWPVRWLAVGS